MKRKGLFEERCDAIRYFAMVIACVKRADAISRRGRFTLGTFHV